MVAVPVLVKRIVEAYRRVPPGAGWDRFLEDTSPELNDLQSVLADLRDGDLTERERILVERIERRREELSLSDDVITYRDFGAGTADAPRTEQQLIEGVPDERRVADLVKASIPREWGLLLLKLICRFRPTRLVELGSALGISGAYQAAALRLNNLGQLFTLEGCPRMADYARRTISLIDADRAYPFDFVCFDSLNHLFVLKARSVTSMILP